MTALFGWILEKSLYGSVVIVCILCLRAVLCRWSRKYAYALWAAVGLRLLWPFSLKNHLDFFGLPLFDGAIWEGLWRLPAGQAASGGIGEEVGRFAAAFEAAAVLWLAGVLLFFAYFLFSFLWMKRRVRLAVRLEAEVYECDRIASPFVMGIFRPRIYLPQGLTEEQKACILCHERFHIRRRDYLVKLLVFFLLALYWFQPLVWLAWFLACRDMEMSCDEKVIEELGTKAKKSYCSVLLGLGQMRGGAPSLPGFGENGIKGRIRHVLGFQKPGPVAAEILTLICVAALIIWGVGGTRGSEEGTKSGQETEERDGTISPIGGADGPTEIYIRSAR